MAVTNSPPSARPPGGLLDQARTVIQRLERLSVDSHWAHRASGLRRSLVRAVDNLGDPACPDPAAAAGELEVLLASGYAILENAARAMGDHA